MNASDGGGGFLWKGAERTGNLVVLLPGKFKSEFDSVTAERLNGKIVELYPTGFANADPDGLRQHWRFDIPIRKFKDNSLVVASEPGNTCAWRIKDASKRND